MGPLYLQYTLSASRILTLLHSGRSGWGSLSGNLQGMPKGSLLSLALQKKELSCLACQIDSQKIKLHNHKWVIKEVVSPSGLLLLITVFHLDPLLGLANLDNTFSQLVYEDIMGKNVKSLTDVQVDIIDYYSLVCQVRHFILQGYQVHQVSLPSCEYMLATPTCEGLSCHLCSCKRFPGVVFCHLLLYIDVS